MKGFYREKGLRVDVSYGQEETLDMSKEEEWKERFYKQEEKKRKELRRKLVMEHTAFITEMERKNRRIVENSALLLKKEQEKWKLKEQLNEKKFKHILEEYTKEAEEKLSKSQRNEQQMQEFYQKRLENLHKKIQSLTPQKKTCLVCKNFETGIACSEGHFVCKECLDLHVLSWSGDDNLRLLEQYDQGVRCIGFQCKKIYLESDLSKSLQNSTFVLLTKAKKKVEQTLIRRQLLDQRREEMKRKAKQPLSEQIFLQIRNYLVDSIFTLSCPRCGQAFPEIQEDGELGFTGCFALTCSSPGCRCGFCAYCFQDNGDSTGNGDLNHKHVRSKRCCSENQEGLFGSKKAFQSSVRRRRTRQLNDLMAHLKTFLLPSIRQKIMRSVEKELQEFGLDSVLKPESGPIWTIDLNL